MAKPISQQPPTADRRLVYLDMNVWIDLVESREASAVADAILDAVDDGSLLCPLSAPLMWELYRQEYDSALRLAPFMERASKSRAIRARDESQRLEIRTVIYQILGQETEHEPCLVPLLGYLTTDLRIEFQQEWSNADKEAFTAWATDRLSKMTLTEFITLRRNDFGQAPHEPPEFQEAWTTRKELARNSPVRARRVEFEALWRDQITPVLFSELQSMSIDERLAFWKRVAELPVDRWDGHAESLVAMMPSWSAFLDVLIASGADPNRMSRITDFFDLEHLTCALPTVTAFVSKDAWLFSVHQRLTNPGCDFLGTLDDLHAFILAI